MLTLTTLIARFLQSRDRRRARPGGRETLALEKRVLTFHPCRLPVPVPIPVPRTRRAAWAAALGLALALPGTAGASHDDFEMTADGRLIDVQVQVEGRGVVPLYNAPGRFDRRYFQAFRGRNYSLVLRNNSGRRVGVLLAVDGLNVISGDRSGLSRHEPMYVLDPYERAVIRGWRTSLDQVRRFVFVDEERSYAERTGQANGDMGWIRVLAFREQRRLWTPGGKVRTHDMDELEPFGAREDQERRNQASPERAQEGTAPMARGELAPPMESESKLHSGRDAAESNPGTGWGREQWDRVQRTNFVAEPGAVDRFTLRYEYASGLRALGIRLWRPYDRLQERERGELGFAQPPRR